MPVTTIPSRAVKLVVPYREQRSSSPFTALGMVMDYWHDRNDSNTVAMVIASDITLDRCYNHEPTTDRLMWEVAEYNGYFDEGRYLNLADGGIYNAPDLAYLAQDFGYQAVAVHITLANRHYAIQESINAGSPILIPFDLDGLAGRPGFFQGQHVQWCVIIGYFDDKFIVKYGWGGNGPAFWDADTLLQSNAQVQPNIRGQIVRVTGNA